MNPEIELTETTEDELSHPVRCEHCEETVEACDTRYVDGEGETWCEACIEAESQCCDRCGRTYSDNNGSSLGNGAWYCDSCRDRYCFFCEDCDEWSLDRDGVTVYDNRGRERYICEGCYSDGNYYRCADCGDAYLPGCLTYHDGDDEHYCNDCIGDHLEDDEDGCGSNRIHDYSYKPRATFFGDGKDKLFLGVELEVNTRDSSHAGVVNGMLNCGEGHVYLKRDGSLSNGFEIVTHPHDLKSHGELWQNWEAPSGMTSHMNGECGIHVHVSRAALSAYQVGKVLLFINDPKNKAFIETIAQRSTERWARLIPSKGIKSARHCPESRYEAVNLCNRSTIEFRIFRGNTRRERIMKCIEFSHAVCSFVKQESAANLTVNSFVWYVRKNRKQYANLDGFLVEKGYLPVIGKAKAAAAGAGAIVDE